jgi:hypothetical protein
MNIFGSVEVCGVPDKFWLVQRDASYDKWEDMCEEVSFQELLSRNTILPYLHGIYADQDQAYREAKRMFYTQAIERAVWSAKTELERRVKDLEDETQIYVWVGALLGADHPVVKALGEALDRLNEMGQDASTGV